MTIFKSKLLGAACAAFLTLGACASMPATDNAATTLSADTYTLDKPLTDFTDFILVKTGANPRIVSMDEAIEVLSAYDVVFVGEAHGHTANHIAQAKIFAGLYAKNNNIALSMEQFERPAQSVMDAYLKGEIGEETLVHDGKAWPHYRSSYRPLIEFAKVNELSVIAAEVPGNMVSCVGERGPDFLDTLNGDARGYIADELHLEDGPYKDKFFEFLKAAAGHHVSGNLSAAEQEKQNFYRYAAQVSRDDTMAESMALHLKENPGRKIMHVNGSFHSAGLLGTPARLEMRVPGVKMANVHPVMVDDPARPSFQASDLAEGEYLLLISPTPKRFVQMKNINAFMARTRGEIDKDKCSY